MSSCREQTYVILLLVSLTMSMSSYHFLLFVGGRHLDIILEYAVHEIKIIVSVVLFVIFSCNRIYKIEYQTHQIDVKKKIFFHFLINYSQIRQYNIYNKMSYMNYLRVCIYAAG